MCPLSFHKPKTVSSSEPLFLSTTVCRVDVVEDIEKRELKKANKRKGQGKKRKSAVAAVVAAVAVEEESSPKKKQKKTKKKTKKQ